MATSRNNNKAFLSLSFLLVFALSALGASFFAGRMCRNILLEQILLSPPADDAEILTTVVEKEETFSDTADEAAFTETVEIAADGSVVSAQEEDDDDDEEDDDEEETRGQQLLVDYHNLDSFFLSSKHRLMTAMREYLLQDKDNNLALHTCQPHRGSGFHCWAFLAESGARLTLTSWPLVGTLALEIFQNEGSLLQDGLDRVEQMFGVPRPRPSSGADLGPPYLQWALKPRGLFNYHSNPESIDLAYHVTSVLQRAWKKRIASVDTKFQRIDVYDMTRFQYDNLTPYQNMQQTNTYESQHPELFRMDRIIYLDSVMQSRFFGEAAYHESLVHPALVTHPNPRRVVIIGGGEGATLREVLKHRTVETVTMVEIDEEMVNVSRQYIPEWSDCSQLIGSADNCFDDPRAELFCVDAIGWFMERFGDEKTIDTERYDVIIMDALDPDAVVFFSDLLYDNAPFAKAMGNALNDDGIFIMQNGIASDSKEKPKEYLSDKQYELMLINHLHDNGLTNVYSYEDPGAGFLASWSYTIAFKTDAGTMRWFSNQAEVDIRLQKRAMPTVSGELPFRYFDGATMMYYQYPSAIDEEVNCIQAVIPPKSCEEGKGFPTDIPLVPASTLSTESLPDGSVRVFSTEDIAAGSYVGTDEAVHAIYFSPQTANIVGSSPQSKIVEVAMKQVGDAWCSNGATAYLVDTGPLGLMSKDCKEISYLGREDNISRLELACPATYFHIDERDTRSRRVSLLTTASRGIPAGADLSSNLNCPL